MNRHKQTWCFICALKFEPNYLTNLNTYTCKIAVSNTLKTKSCWMPFLTGNVLKQVSFNYSWSACIHFYISSTSCKIHISIFDSFRWHTFVHDSKNYRTYTCSPASPELTKLNKLGGVKQDNFYDFRLFRRPDLIFLTILYEWISSLLWTKIEKKKKKKKKKKKNSWDTSSCVLI